MRMHRSREGWCILKLHVEHREAQNLSIKIASSGRERKKIECTHQRRTRSKAAASKSQAHPCHIHQVWWSSEDILLLPSG